MDRDVDPAQLFATESEMSFTGSGKIARKGTLTATLPVRVKQELGNGDLYVEAGPAAGPGLVPAYYDFSSEDASQPRSTWIAAWPTPPAAACTSTVSTRRVCSRR